MGGVEKKIKTIFLVVEERKDEWISNTNAFSDRETALAFAQEQIDYYHKILKPEPTGFVMDYFAWRYYIQNKFDISLNEIWIDYVIPKKKARLCPNCLSKNYLSTK